MGPPHRHQLLRYRHALHPPSTTDHGSEQADKRTPGLVFSCLQGFEAATGRTGPTLVTKTGPGLAEQLNCSHDSTEYRIAPHCTAQQSLASPDSGVHQGQPKCKSLASSSQPSLLASQSQSQSQSEPHSRVLTISLLYIFLIQFSLSFGEPCHLSVGNGPRHRREARSNAATPCSFLPTRPIIPHRLGLVTRSSRTTPA